MASYTKNYNLKKPAGNDAYNIEDQNGNMDLLDQALKNKADLSNGKVSAEQIPELSYIKMTEKGAANGVASLDSSGKVQSTQLPAMNYEASGTAASAVTAHNQNASAHSSLFAAKAVKKKYTATLSATWSGTAAPFTQSVTVSGILASDTPHIVPVYSSDNATALQEKEAWNCVSKAVTSAGKITFTCFEEKPEVALSLQIEVIR